MQGIDRIMFPQLPPEDREQHLEGIADEIIDEAGHSFNVELTIEERNDLQQVFAALSMEKERLEEELRTLTMQMKEQIKPIAVEAKEALSQLRTGRKDYTGRVYKVVFHEERTTAFYTATGELISTRSAMSNELNPNIFTALRKQA